MDTHGVGELRADPVRVERRRPRWPDPAAAGQAAAGHAALVYILREAEFNGGKLKGAGARIVAERFPRAMEGSQFSLVRDPAWRPSLGPNNQTFRMVDLLLFAFKAQKALLNPLGGA